MSDLSVFEEAAQELRDYGSRLRRMLTDEQWESLGEACRSGKYPDGAVRKVIISWTDDTPHHETVRRLIARFQSGELV